MDRKIPLFKIYWDEDDIISVPDGFNHVYQMYTIRVPGGRRDGLIRHLADAGIMSKVFFHPVHKTNYYKTKLKYNDALPVTDKISAEVLTLPMYANLSEAEINLIAFQINAYFSK